jgi:hypothetical protein
VFLPIFYPVMDALAPVLAERLDIAPHMVMVWFGATVAVVLQTAFLSPPVAMSAYYLRQVVRQWSLATIYIGMFQFMVLQVIAISLIVSFPAIATYFPEMLQERARMIETIEVEDAGSLEDYGGGYGTQLREALEGSQEEEETTEEESLETDEQPQGTR